MIFSYVFSLMALFLFCIIQCKINDNIKLEALNFTILNKEQSIEIPLEGYFPFSKNYSVYKPQSSDNISQILDINFSLNKIQNQSSLQMIGKLNNKSIDLSAYKIMDIKTIYNQPHKIFLLQNNTIMMYSYREKSQDKIFLNSHSQIVYNIKKKAHSKLKQFEKQEVFDQLEQNGKFEGDKQEQDMEDNRQITVYNISSDVNISGVRNYNLSCFQTETLPLQGGYKFIVLCKMTANSPPQVRNYIVTYNMEQNNQGYITNLKYNSSNYIENNKFIHQNTIHHKQAQKQKQIIQDQTNYNFNEKIATKEQNKRKVQTSKKKQQQSTQIQEQEDNKERPFDAQTLLNKKDQKQKQPNKSNQDKIHKNNTIPIDWRGPVQNCLEYHLKYFDQLVIQQKFYQQTVILYCNSTNNISSIKQLYEVAFYSKGLIIKIISNPSLMNITSCLINSKYITKFENGFISVKSPDFSIKPALRIYKYSHKVNSKNQYQTECRQQIPANLSGYQFITSRNQSGIDTIYVIFSNKILIFESYSPNYQTLLINEENFTLKSYAISNQILSLHFEDQESSTLIIKAYNIKSMYPHLIDQVEYEASNSTKIELLSVMNYLQKANYFFIYERQTNLLNLTYYSGQYLNISVKDPAKAVGLLKLSITNYSSQQHPNFSPSLSTLNSSPTDQFSSIDTLNLSQLATNVIILPIYLKIRAFCDTSIEIVQIPQIKLNSKMFNINLVEAVIGPLGRFYKMPNPSSFLQFVNSFHQIDITDILNRFKDKKLMTFSIDNFLNFPILTFYFENLLFLKCDLQFDFSSMRPVISRCFEVIETQTANTKPQQIIIYGQDKFIQHQGHRIQFCRIQSSRDTTCIQGDFEVTEIKKIKLIKYSQIQETESLISVFIIFDHGLKQKDYRMKLNPVSQKDIQILLNMEITQNQVQYLKYMTIRTVEYDQGYQNFLLLYMMDYFNPVYESQHTNCNPHSHNTFQNLNSNQKQDPCSLKQTYLHIIQIYSKPQLQPNQSSHFIGHLIGQFIDTDLDNVFIIDNKVLLLSIKPSGSIIEEYRIMDFKCVKVRNYPLYDHIITKNGSHSINSGFLFVQVEQLQQQITKYLVYNPSMNTTNIMTHSFEKTKDEKLIFIQKLGPSQNVMAIHGNKLITLSLPNMVIKLNQVKIPQKPFNTFHSNIKKHGSSYVFQTQLGNKQEDLQQSDSVNISFIDNNDILRLLSFNYSYDLSDSKIDYSKKLNNHTRFANLSDYFQLKIDPSQITGPVSQYNILNFTDKSLTNFESKEVKDICQFIDFNSSDIFTKTKCIKYFNSKQDGIMQDFLTYETGLFQDITIIVTDKKILCIENMIIQNKTLKNKTKDCNMFQQDSRIFIICTQNNSTTMNILEMSQKCQIELIELIKPDFLKYNLFSMVYSKGQAVFQVPIRSQTNMVYYVTNFYINNMTFDESSNLLKHQSQQEFITKDFTVNDRVMFMLENGLGIYDLTKRNQSTKKMTPDVWIDRQELMDKFGLQEQLAYVNCLQLNYEQERIVLEIGTTFHSFQLNLSFQIVNQTFQIKQILVGYVYKNPWSCYNTLLSKSRYYKDMTIKMCSFIPQEHYIFSNFIPISENKQNSYIVFYQKNFQTNQSYPFRMDIIYTNIYSNDNFQIPLKKAKLLIGSLFNLLCEYDLRDTFVFNFSLNPKLKDYLNQESNDLVRQKQCHFSLNLSNQNYEVLSNFTIRLDFEQKNRQYWTDWKHWIQRVFFVLVILNYVRLQYVKRAELKRLNTIKIKRSRSGSFDQEFDLQVRFKSKKSL